MWGVSANGEWSVLMCRKVKVASVFPMLSPEYLELCEGKNFENIPRFRAALDKLVQDEGRYALELTNPHQLTMSFEGPGTPL
jgi:hypothetical protein